MTCLLANEERGAYQRFSNGDDVTIVGLCFAAITTHKV